MVDTFGVHSVHVNWCACGRIGDPDHVGQLMRHGWWPATTDMPRTVISFGVLRHFYALNATGRMNVYDYYTSLHRLTDNTGTRPPKVRIPLPLFWQAIHRHRHQYQHYPRPHLHQQQRLPSWAPGRVLSEVHSHGRREFGQSILCAGGGRRMG